MQAVVASVGTTFTDDAADLVVRVRGAAPRVPVAGAGGARLRAYHPLVALAEPAPGLVSWINQVLFAVCMTRSPIGRITTGFSRSPRGKEATSQPRRRDPVGSVGHFSRTIPSAGVLLGSNQAFTACMPTLRHPARKLWRPGSRLDRTWRLFRTRARSTFTNYRMWSLKSFI